MESIDSICHNLEAAFADQKDDPLSLVTIIEMYSDQVESEGKQEEKEQYLEKLVELLGGHHDVAAQIGWDLPKGLLNFYVSSNLFPYRRLSSNRIVVEVMNCFQEIAVHGNPKECLLTGCQLLSELTIENISQELAEIEKRDSAHGEILRSFTAVTSPAEIILGLRSHVLFELIQTVLRRIETLYPSKFLGMAVSVICKFLRSNMDEIDNTAFFLRRIFAFCRNYAPKEVSNDVVDLKELDSKEIEKINEDESVLQGKLLRNLCTFAIGWCMKRKHLRHDVQYYGSFSDVKTEKHPYYEELFEACSRFYQLAYSFDIDLKEEFLNVIKESKDIYKSLPPDSEISSDEARRGIGQVVYQLSHTYQLQKMAKAKELELDPFGIVVLSGLNYLVTGKHLYPEINLQDAIYLYIRFTTPSLFTDLYFNEAAEEISRYWLWVAITNSGYKELKAQLVEMPSYINAVLLQMLLLRNCDQPSEQSRMITFTLLTRLLCLMPEETTFSFSLDTLLTCPYVKPKICMLGIMKDLMLRSCECKRDLATELMDLKLKDDESVTGSQEAASQRSPPPLPQRAFLSLNEDRMACIHSVSLMALDKASKEERQKEDLLLLLNYLNFFTALRNKWDKNLLKSIHLETATYFNDDTEEKLPEIGFIKVANDTLGKYL
ncbi:hypothetical protein HG537_0G03700 [Torulaspora globosa]|uniref:Uncharacterized protein n=1 Tax=Torulaspora globosa TaxID=48254 RepID=A0A7H9HZU1_9SACH|nr:hypothetical protein HG537_0G03700 [Torulaspora sp. CBS 2947]